MQRQHRWRAIACSIGSFSLLFFAANTVLAQVVNLNANTLVSHASIFLSPQSETIIQGSTFKVSVYLNTYQSSANAIDLTIQFPPNLLSVIQPSTGNSVVGVWIQPPSYSNTDGTVHLTGVIPNGIETGGGLITTITFKAIAPASATLKISPLSTVLANDGQGTQMSTQFGQGTYTIVPAAPTPPAAVVVSSPTNPVQSQWYNNNNPVLTWNNDPAADSFSYVLDNKPFTVPPDTAETSGTTVSYKNLTDGIWYFHIQEASHKIWGASTNFILEIDTQPPAEFTPTVQLDTVEKKASITFTTTDTLSGVNRYEIAVTDNDASSTSSPVFMPAQSPYTLDLNDMPSYHAKVIVRAIDNASNTRDEAVTITLPVPSGYSFIKNNILPIIFGFLVLILILLLILEKRKAVPNISSAADDVNIP